MFEEIIQKCILQVRRECSFFGSLMLFAQIETTKKLPTAATDGRSIFFNEEFLGGYVPVDQLERFLK